MAAHPNYGDLLYPIVLQNLLPDYSVKTFSIFENDAPMGAGYHVHPIKSFFDKDTACTYPLFIGGGAILKGHKDTAIMSFGMEYFKKLQREGKIDHAIAQPDKSFLENFAKDYLDYPSFGPWMLDPSALKAEKLIYFSSGAGAALPHSPPEIIQKFFNPADFIYVRDHITKQHLGNLGVKKPIHAVPDSIVALSDFYPYEAYRKIGMKMLENLGVDTSKKLIVFQSRPLSNDDATTVLRQFLALQAQGYEIVLLPVGLAHHDDLFLESMAKVYNSQVKQKCHYVPIKTIDEIIAVICAGNLVIGTSMHACITAFSYCKPFLIGVTQHAKQLGFLNMCGLDQNLELKDWKTMNDNIDKIIRLDKDFYAEKLKAAKDKIYSCVQGITRILEASST